MNGGRAYLQHTCRELHGHEHAHLLVGGPHQADVDLARRLDEARRPQGRDQLTINDVLTDQEAAA